MNRTIDVASAGGPVLVVAQEDGRAIQHVGDRNQATKTHFHQHCETLIRSYQTEANEYDALAKAHQDMAAKGGK
jgi:hypothetical protein